MFSRIAATPHKKKKGPLEFIPKKLFISPEIKQCGLSVYLMALRPESTKRRLKPKQDSHSGIRNQ
jgi:hypothetical protein